MLVEFGMIQFTSCFGQILQKWCVRLAWAERHLHQRIELYIGRGNEQDLLLPTNKKLVWAFIMPWLLGLKTRVTSVLLGSLMLYIQFGLFALIFFSHANLCRFAVPCKAFYTCVALKFFAFLWGFRDAWPSTLCPLCIMKIEIIRTMWHKIAYESVATCLSFSPANCFSMVICELILLLQYEIILLIIGNFSQV